MQNNDDKNEKLFLDWVSALFELKDMPLRRRQFGKKHENIDLQLSSQASLESMCMEDYLQMEDDDGEDFSFVSGKSRISPKKLQALARLEL